MTSKKAPTVIDGRNHWRCTRCSALLSEEQFYPRKYSANGLTSQCKKCHTDGVTETRDRDLTKKRGVESKRRAQARDPERLLAASLRTKAKYPEKVKARNLLTSAVRYGKIVKPTNCERCGTVAELHGHHADYSKPLDVAWLCPSCHGAEHRRES